MLIYFIGIITSLKLNAIYIISDIIFVVFLAPSLQCTITVYINTISLCYCSETFAKDDFQFQI